MDMNNYMERSTVLVEALPYIQKWYGKTIVIKYGGNAMISQELRSAVISDIILLNLVGVRVVMVHGGGPEIGHMLEKVGKQSRFVDGLRYTDEETMDIVQQVLCGKVNKHLVSIINNLGGKAIGLCGLDGALFQAKKLDDKYGLVGKIVKVEPQVVNDVLACGYIPVVSTVALGIDNDTAYNINADTAAAQLAISLGGGKAHLLTESRGGPPGPQGRQYADPPDPPGGGARPAVQRHHRRGHDPQDPVLRGCPGTWRPPGPHPGRADPPLHPDRDAVP